MKIVQIENEKNFNMGNNYAVETIVRNYLIENDGKKSVIVLEKIKDKRKRTGNITLAFGDVVNGKVKNTCKRILVDYNGFEFKHENFTANSLEELLGKTTILFA